MNHVLSRLDEIERIAVDIGDLAQSVGNLGGWGIPDVIELGTLCVEEGGLVAELASLVAVIAVHMYNSTVTGTLYAMLATGFPRPVKLMPYL